MGESLVCSTTRLFEEIDFLPVMEREGFVRKYGANWVHWADGQQCSLRFRDIPELGISQTYTYHVDRARFDQLLLEHAEARGSRVLQGAHVERVEFGPDGAAVGVRVQHAGTGRLWQLWLAQGETWTEEGLKKAREIARGWDKLAFPF